MLAGALHHHEGPLRAALRAEYGVDLRHPEMSWRDVADLVESLPNGCALWRAMGGPRAWSDELAESKWIRHRLEVLAWQKAGGNKSDYPKADKPPPLAHEVEARQRRESSKAQSLIRRRRERNAARRVAPPPATTTEP